jgi:flagellar hook-associated protein 2
MILSSFFTNKAASPIPVDAYPKVGKTLQQDTAPPKPNLEFTVDKTTLSSLGKLHSAQDSFPEVAQSFSVNGLDFSASSSAEEVLTATTSNRSIAGSYAIQVGQLAQSQVLRSASLNRQDAAIGSGVEAKLSFDFGNASGDTFATNTSVKSGIAVAIPSGANTLQGIAAAINGANIGVTAQVTSGDAGYALELSSPTGADNSMRIGVSGDPALQDLLAFNPIGVKNLSQMATAQNATLMINGVVEDSQNNAVADAVPGTTLNLTATGSSRLVVAQDSAQFGKNVAALLSAYNIP